MVKAGDERVEEEEGVMATDFLWSYTDEPHPSRRRQILSQYPQIKDLFGPAPWAFLKIRGCFASALDCYNPPQCRTAESWLGISANQPIGVQSLEQHCYQGVDGIDMDIPSQTEARLVTNVVTKSIWVIVQLFFYALRPLFLKPKPPGYRKFTNLTIQLALDFVMVYFWGWRSFAYLILSTFVGGGMHPMAGHFISEHYVFHPEQETYA